MTSSVAHACAVIMLIMATTVTCKVAVIEPEETGATGSSQFKNDNKRTSSYNYSITEDYKKIVEEQTSPIIVKGSKMSASIECRRSTLGFDYIGHKNTTISGRTCQAWSSQHPHQHEYNDPKHFPDDTLEDAGNYCRNPPPGPEIGLWCFTTDENKRWDYCDVPTCSEYPECRLTDVGSEYRGRISQTRNGTNCIPWNSIKPAKDTYAGDANYCRNPDKRTEGPWCFTDLDKWDYCSIPFCKPSAYCKRTTEGREYVGTVSETENGLPCQRWDSQFPHQHVFNRPEDFPDADVSEAANHCRNPNGQAAGPWCFTRDSNVRKENCGIPTCVDCKITDVGVEYAGTQSITTSSRPCMRWSDLSEYAAHLKDPNRFPDASVSDASNFCRNPDRKPGGPWCYWNDNPSSWAYCNIPSCSGSGEDVFKPRLANHVLHIGIDGLHPCFINSSTGAPNIMERIANVGSYTLSMGRTEILTRCASSWTAILCSLPVETSGTTSNSWRPPWMGYNEAITPSFGKEVPFPCIWQQIKSRDAGIRTASFTNWSWFWYMTSLGLPTALDYDFYCNDYQTCDEQLVLTAADYLENALRSADSTYTFVYIGNVDGTGHSNGWCGSQYMRAVDEADRLVGLLMNVVDRAELDTDPERPPNKVTVLLSTDHGGHTDAHDAYQDSDLIIPAFFRGPRASGGAGGAQFRHEVRNVDYAPTALEWLGLKQNAWWHGRVRTDTMNVD